MEKYRPRMNLINSVQPKFRGQGHMWDSRNGSESLCDLLVLSNFKLKLPELMARITLMSIEMCHFLYFILYHQTLFCMVYIVCKPISDGSKHMKVDQWCRTIASAG